ncbi:MAG: hypothetical protein RLZZ232_2019, partial [Planctomycetota bacterium]
MHPGTMIDGKRHHPSATPHDECGQKAMHMIESGQ